MSYPSSSDFTQFNRSLSAKLAINEREVIGRAKGAMKTNNYCDDEQNTTGGGLETIRRWFNNLQPVINGALTPAGLVLPEFTEAQLSALSPGCPTLAIDTTNCTVVLFNPTLGTWEPIAVIDTTPQTFADVFVLSDNPQAPGTFVDTEIPLTPKYPVLFLNRVRITSDAALDEFSVAFFDNPNNPGGRADPANAVANQNGPGLRFILEDITDFAGGPGTITRQIGIYIGSADTPPAPFDLYARFYKEGVLVQGPTVTIALEGYPSPNALIS